MTLRLVGYIYFLFEEHIKLFLFVFINIIYNKVILLFMMYGVKYIYFELGEKNDFFRT